MRIHYGGPVEPERVFILHTPDYRSEATHVTADGIALTPLWLPRTPSAWPSGRMVASVRISESSVPTTRPAAICLLPAMPRSLGGVQGPELGEVVEFPEVGGLHHRYERAAA
jgi:hypothetical protein